MWALRATVGRVLLAAGFVAAVLLTAAEPASAHASFVASQPQPGAQLSTAPGVVVLRFSEPLIEELSGATVQTPTGQRFEGSASGEREIQVRLQTNAHGEYTVRWKTVSPIDGHTLQGQFQFGVGVDVGAQAEPSSAPSATDLVVAVARVVEYVGLLGTLGWLTLSALARGRELEWVPSGLHRWVVVGAVGGLLVVGGEVLLAGTGSLVSSTRAFLAAGSGLPRVLRLATELAAVVTVIASVRRRDELVPGPAARWWAGALTSLALLLLAASGHAAAARPAAAGIFADGVHLIAAGVWAGSIGAMALHRPPGGWRSEQGRAVLAGFPRVAIPTFGLTVVFGSVRGLQELSTISDLWSTAYGQVLSAKVALVAAMLPLSWRAFQARHPRPRIEAWLAVGAVAAAAVLAAFPAPPGRTDEVAHASDEPPATDALPRPGDLTLATGAGDTLVGLTLRPAEPGINDVYVHLVPITGEDDAGDIRATLRVDGAAPRAMEECGTPCRLTTVTLRGGETIDVSLSGTHQGTATFQLPDLPAQEGGDLLERLVARTDQLDTWTYVEELGPADPPVESRWAIDEHDALWGAVDSRSGYYETLRIGQRTWERTAPDAPWELESTSARPLGQFPFIWEYEGRIAAKVVGDEILQGVRTRIVTFFVDVGAQPIWYRLWVDEGGLVHRAEMRAQGHFMDHVYRHFDAPLRIEPPPAGYQPPPS